MTRFRTALASLAAAALAACTVGPDYQRPNAVISANFKEQAGWSPAAPADTLGRGDWWSLFGDPVLNDLMHRVNVSNQNLIAAEAAYRQARAAVAEQRAALFPAVDLTAGATRSGGGRTRSGGGVIVGSGSGATVSSGGGGTTYRASLGASWELDVWGRIRRTIEAARDQAQASEADLAAARLSAQGELAADYFGLREADAEAELDRMTVEAYRRTLQVATNRYNAGIAARSDLLQAQTQLDNAQADLAGLVRTRATYEHAIAVLIGAAPADVTVTPAAWNQTLPAVPPTLPSTLLQRRPDIAAAERLMAAANAQIGVQRAAYYPSISLTGSYGFTGSSLGSLFSASNALWSLGVSAAETLFDAGARKARVSQARAAYDQAVAQYRQTVLTALQDVEDQLSASSVLAAQYDLRRDASAAADAAQQMVSNRYQAGQVSFVEVATAQASAYAARRALVQAASQRQAAAVSLIQSLGGGWTGL